MAFLRLCALVLAGALLTGCGSSVPQCGDEWVREAAFAKFKQSEREWIESRLAHDEALRDGKCFADRSVADNYLNQDFWMVGVRTTDTDWMAKTRSCLAEVYGRKLRFYNFCDVDPATLTEKVRHVESISYIIIVDDEGTPHVR